MLALCCCEHCGGACGRPATVCENGRALCELCRHTIEGACGWQATGGRKMATINWTHEDLEIKSERLFALYGEPVPEGWTGAERLDVGVEDGAVFLRPTVDGEDLGDLGDMVPDRDQLVELAGDLGFDTDRAAVDRACAKPETDRAEVVFELEREDTLSDAESIAKCCPEHAGLVIVKDENGRFWISPEALDAQVEVGLEGDDLVTQYANWASAWGLEAIEHLCDLCDAHGLVTPDAPSRGPAVKEICGMGLRNPRPIRICPFCWDAMSEGEQAETLDE